MQNATHPPRPAGEAGDPGWAGALRFLDGRIPAGLRVVAPERFASVAGPLAPPDPAVLPDWAVVALAGPREVPAALLGRLLAETTPVYANEGYVVFARRPTFGLADMRSAGPVQALAARAAGGDEPPPPTYLEASAPESAEAPEAPMTPPRPGPALAEATMPPRPAPADADLTLEAALALLLAPPAGPDDPPPPPEPPARAPDVPRPPAPEGRAALPAPASGSSPAFGEGPPLPLAAAGAEPLRDRPHPEPLRPETPVPETQVPEAPISGAPVPGAQAPGSPEAEAPGRGPVPPRRLPGGWGGLPARVAALLGTGTGLRIAALGGETGALSLAEASFAAGGLLSDASGGLPGACLDAVLLLPAAGSLAADTAEAARLLRDRGAVLVVAENAASLGRRLAAALGRAAEPPGTTLAALRGALRAAGLVPVHVEGHSLDAWRATAGHPPAGLAPDDPASALLEEAGAEAGPRHAAWLLVLARKD